MPYQHYQNKGEGARDRGKNDSSHPFCHLSSHAFPVSSSADVASFLFYVRGLGICGLGAGMPFWMSPFDALSYLLIVRLPTLFKGMSLVYLHVMCLTPRAFTHTSYNAVGILFIVGQCQQERRARTEGEGGERREHPSTSPRRGTKASTT